MPIQNHGNTNESLLTFCFFRHKWKLNGVSCWPFGLVGVQKTFSNWPGKLQNNKQPAVILHTAFKISMQFSENAYCTGQPYVGGSEYVF